jgi:DHA1 family tetracycline resistance protein-like MFS transporter
MSGVVPPNAQGALQGGISSVSSITAIFSPFMMTQLFSYFSGPSAPVHFPGAAFLAAGLLELVAAALLIRLLRRGLAAKPA